MSNSDQLTPEALSALVDGEADAGVVAAASARWRDDAATRERWHSYQLIGDALRSDELGGRGRDAEFLLALRKRLEQEPTVIAPAAIQRPARGRRAGALRRWAPPAAIAAGFLAVAGALTVTRVSAPPPASPQLVQAPSPVLVQPLPVVAAASAVAAETLARAVPERAEPATGVLIRDARIDQYLAAHKQFGGSSALGVPSGFLRSATYEVPGAVAAGSR